MKSIMKKIAMMGMLVCMASLNTYTSGSSLESQVKSQVGQLSQSFATIAHDANLSDTLQNEYKALTAAITDLLAPLKTEGTINENKANSVSNQFTKFQNDLGNDSTFQAYAASKPNDIDILNHQFYDLNNELSTLHSLHQVNIKILNLAPNNFIVAGVLYNDDGTLDYSKQVINGIPDRGNNSTCTFYSNYSYAVGANNTKSITNPHKGTDFLGKTKWDVANNIIS